jgi:tetratricopeptide (TPR) repeat protein
MEHLDYIEKFFNKELGAGELAEFEKKIETDPAFAEEVAFYVSAMETGRSLGDEETRDRFKEVYKESRPNRSAPVRRLVYTLVSAAAVVALVIGFYTITTSAPADKLAETYIKEHLQTLGVTMNARADSMQTGLRYYNEGKVSEALNQFQSIVQSDTSNYTAKKYAGLCALRLQNYDLALHWFDELKTYTTLYSNPALFYSALTLMKRNQPGDAVKAKQLLQEVVDKDLEFKETAQEWLKKL